MDPPQPSEDPGDATGDDERRPDAPTEPPDKPLDEEVEGARVEGSEVETAMAEASRVVQESPDEDGSDERRPGMADEPPDEAQVESRGPDSVQVEPGGETEARRNGGVTHECADTGIDGMAEEAHGDVQFEAERSATCPNASIEGERGSTLAQGRSMTTVEENDKRTSLDVEDVPEDPPEPPPPLTSPDETARSQDEPPSVELEGERKGIASCDTGPTTGDADVAEYQALTKILGTDLGRRRTR